ncbi:YraN family protein [Phenylobacterium sp.]|uniref:YraN family protein n=1 Tax=Phenylobacterium sp. TaxID=1871053 RepID=UPI0026266FFA|nr:YraN family protein [Phenylobacterium sp.]
MTTPEPSTRTAARQVRGALARRSGRRAEAWAALWLMAKGYRILGFRLRTRLGEIDLLAQKGRVLAVVEVKSRATLEAALAAVTPEQRDRLRRAGQAAAGARPRLKDLAVRLDLIALAPGRLPRHRPDAWNGA